MTRIRSGRAEGALGPAFLVSVLLATAVVTASPVRGATRAPPAAREAAPPSARIHPPEALVRALTAVARAAVAHEGAGLVARPRRELEGTRPMWGVAHEEAPRTGQYREPMPAGDFDGDGLEDVLETTVRFRGRDSIRLGVNAVSGRSGALLWSLDDERASYLFPMPLGDVTRDGLSDVLLVGGALEGRARFECGEAGCVGLEPATHRSVLSMRSGETGAQLWAHYLSGHAVLAGAFINGKAAYPYGLVVAFTDAVAVLLRGDDHDGDGAADLVLNVVDVALAGSGTFVEHESTAAGAGGDALVTRTSAEVISGRDGRRLLQRLHGFAPGFAVLLPTGNAVGSARGDLLWQRGLSSGWTYACSSTMRACHSTAAALVRLEMIDGETLESSWAADRAGFGLASAFVFPSGGDLDGDGSEDLLAFEVESDREGPFVAGVSGRTGALLWRRAAGSWWPAVIGPVGGRPGSDLIILVPYGDSPGDRFHRPSGLALVRLDGATGRPIFRTRHRADGGFFDALVIGDLDADGVRDVLIGVLQEQRRPAGGAGKRRPSRLIAESGRTGSKLLALSSSHALHAFPAGDLDERDGEDLVVIVRRVREERHSHTLIALAMPDRRILWSRGEREARRLGFSIYRAGDVVGDGGADLLYVRTVPGKHVRSQLSAIDGRTGRTIWSRGDRIAG